METDEVIVTVVMGDKVVDTITNLKGTVTGFAQYMNSESTALVEPMVGEGGKATESQWIALKRLRVDA